MSPPYASFESSDTSGASLLNTTTVLRSFTNIHERPIFWSLATNLGTTFKAPKNLGARAPGLFSSSLQLSLTLVPDPQASQGVRSFELSIASIHERPIFWSLATNLGTIFKAPKNLGALAPRLFSSSLKRIETD